MSESNGNGTNGATAVAEPEEAQDHIRAVAAVQTKQRPFNIPAELATKLAAARTEVKAVAKNGHNKDQNYSYVQAEDVVKEAGRALATAKVVVMPPEPLEIEMTDVRSNRGSSGKTVIVKFAVRVVDGETGEGYETERIGTASDYPGDKAIYKAETGMMKYFLSSLLQMPLGDGTIDPEATEHGGGAVNQTDTSPASDKQKDLFKTLIGEKNLPRPAKKAIVAFVGGDEPKKGAISHAIDQLMNADPLKFAGECGWDGTVDDEQEGDAGQEAAGDTTPGTEPAAENPPAPTDEQSQARAATTQEPVGDLPEAEGEALIQFCRHKGATKGELSVILRSVGMELPPDSDLDDKALYAALKGVPSAAVARIIQMVTSAAEAKKAASAAGGSKDPKGSDSTAPEAADSTEVDPNSPLGKAMERAAALGYKSEFTNLAWLLFDTETPGDLKQNQLDQLVAKLERANKVGIQQAGVAACIRKAREGEHEPESRVERFESWITTKEEKAAATKAADEAHAAAEGPQE
ncbi:MAG: ERF family protein [Solirubrobacterales bacterium]|nr:ERF family protein [Solirubrobacterales bacterium]